MYLLLKTNVALLKMFAKSRFQRATFSGIEGTEPGYRPNPRSTLRCYLRSRLLAISLIASAATPVLAVAENSPPEHEAQTPSHYECGTIPGSVSENECIDRRLRILDVELNTAYKFALASLPKHSDKDLRKERGQLRRSQLAWVKYKGENCALVGGLAGDMSQTITFNSLLCNENALKERIRFLRQVSNANEP